MSWAHSSDSAQSIHGRKMKGKLTRTQMRPTRCQDFFWPYLLHQIILYLTVSGGREGRMGGYLHSQKVSGLSERPPTKVVLSPSATWPTRRITPA